jgi:hypothetical protein
MRDVRTKIARRAGLFPARLEKGEKIHHEGTKDTKKSGRQPAPPMEILRTISFHVAHGCLVDLQLGLALRALLRGLRAFVVNLDRLIFRGRAWFRPGQGR